MTLDWAKSVDAEMQIPRKSRALKSFRLRNAYQVKLEREYNPGKSVRHPTGVKMYAELKRKKKLKKPRIKSHGDNKLEFNWKQYYANVSIAGIDKLKNAGEAQVIDFVKSKVKNAERTLAQQLGDGLYSSGTDTKALVGLRVALANSNTVGGISQTDYSWWRMQADSSSTTLSLPLMKSKYEAATVDNEKPTIIVTTRTLHNSFWGLLQPQQRFQDAKRASAGFDNIMFQGTAVVADSKCPASHMFMINQAHFFLSVHREADMKFIPFVRPINQDVESAKILWAGALCYSNLRLLAGFSALTA